MAGPRAPARQMVIRIMLCPCHEGREDQENQPNPGFPRNPSLAPLPLLSTVCSIFLPTHPPPNQHPLNRVYLQCTRTPGPRAPARQMVVRIILSPCHEGREDQENQPNPPFFGSKIMNLLVFFDFEPKKCFRVPTP